MLFIRISLMKNRPNGFEENCRFAITKNDLPVIDFYIELFF
jgi:hypothetical protein